MKVAIVGSGIAGLAAAYGLPGHQVTMFEAAPHVGGHTYTVETNGLSIDMGFIVHNRERYPHFSAMLRDLEVQTRSTTMAFSVADGALEWGSGSLDAMFADRRSLLRPTHWRFLIEVMRFLARARTDLQRVGEASLDEYLAARNVSREVRAHFVVPLAAALWSLAPDRCGEFPARTYLAFLDQHGMLSPIRPLAWHTIVGGSQRYVEALLAKLAARGTFELRTRTPVERIARDGSGVVVAAGGEEGRYDRIVIAAHADTALALLADPSEEERVTLGAFRYSANRTVLHTDRAFLPSRPAAHAAWNYVADPDTARVAVTYSMTKLQGLPDVPYLVTLNPRSEPKGILHEVAFTHPQFDRAALAAQRVLPRLSGARNTFYAGAHFGFGFHEDGARSGLAAAHKIATHR